MDCMLCLIGYLSVSSPLSSKYCNVLNKSYLVSLDYNAPADTCISTVSTYKCIDMYS